MMFKPLLCVLCVFRCCIAPNTLLEAYPYCPVSAQFALLLVRTTKWPECVLLSTHGAQCEMQLVRSPQCNYRSQGASSSRRTFSAFPICASTVFIDIPSATAISEYLSPCVRLSS